MKKNIYQVYIYDPEGHVCSYDCEGYKDYKAFKKEIGQEVQEKGYVVKVYKQTGLGKNAKLEEITW